MKFKLIFEMEDWNCDFCRYQEKFFDKYSCENLNGIYNTIGDVIKYCPLKLVGDEEYEI